jgi:hypothetical protein
LAACSVRARFDRTNCNLSRDSQLDFVRSIASSDCTILLEDRIDDFLTPANVDDCALCLVDGGVNATMAGLLNSSGVTRVVGTRGLRWPIPGWSHSSWVANHWVLGGVTSDSVLGICSNWGLLLPTTTLLKLKGIAGCDATSTVLGVKAPAHKYRSAPSLYPSG